MRWFSALLLSVCISNLALAHDTWVQTNTNVVRTGDAVHIDLMLGNHGNEHRDFKLASKVSLDACTLHLASTEGKSYDLKPQLADVGYAPKEGFWTTRFLPARSGLYTVSHTMDGVFHGVRGVKSGKTYFVASDSLDKVPLENPGFDKPLGHALEIIPVANPVTPMGPGQPIRMQVLFQGKPLADARMAFIPRGAELERGFDKMHERMTDPDGVAEFTPTEGNYYLVAVHYDRPDEKGEGYELTRYAATLVVFVPQVCPCCGE
jgi:uncharacterized GH25 family protein